eukprot:scaffold5968_cov17-Prasinocladus_malaysianus.AAC.1
MLVFSSDTMSAQWSVFRPWLTVLEILLTIGIGNLLSLIAQKLLATIQNLPFACNQRNRRS